jgi:hypothetical protein
MSKLRELTVLDVEHILKTGTFTELISAVEHIQFECKSGIYDFKVVNNKIELAKDVSAMANSHGGYILIGPETKKNSFHHGDEIVSVSQFGSDLFEPDTYRNILNNMIYPPIAELRIEWHPGTDPAKGIASIFVPPKSTSEKPFLVVQSDIDSKIRGNMFGYFERQGDDALHTTVEALRDTIKDGKRYGELNRKIDNVEGLIAKLVSDRQDAANTITSEQLLQRAGDAKISADMGETASFFLLAAPTQPTKLEGLYASSRSVERRLLNNPPKFRRFGFDLDPGNPIEQVRGEALRRTTRGRKGLELWQDGTLIFVGRNDENYLGWGVPGKNGNLYINNYVLTEVIALFFRLTLQLYPAMHPPPEQIRIMFGLTRDINYDSTYELSHHPINVQWGMSSGSKIPAKNKIFQVAFDPKATEPEVEALRLLREIYHWFGITDENVPYVDRTSFPERIDVSRYSEE